MADSGYGAKLKDPRWQRKRLEILERDSFKCTECGASDKTLHVHHLIYKSGAEPWEYENDALATLCEFHHDIRHKQLDLIKEVTRYYTITGLQALINIMVDALEAQNSNEILTTLSDLAEKMALPHPK